MQTFVNFHHRICDIGNVGIFAYCIMAISSVSFLCFHLRNGFTAMSELSKSDTIGLLLAGYGVFILGTIFSLAVYAEKEAREQLKAQEPSQEFKCPDKTKDDLLDVVNPSKPHLPAIRVQFSKAKPLDSDWNLATASIAADDAWSHPALPLPEYRLQDGNSEWAVNGVHIEPPALEEAGAPQPQN